MNTATRSRAKTLKQQGSLNYPKSPCTGALTPPLNIKTLREYGYDSYHNRVSLTDESGTTKSSFNALNQLISSIDASGTEISCSYDLRGNQVEKYLDEKLISKYHFGALNRREEVQNFTTEQSASYHYSGVGHRVAKTIDDLEPTLPHANSTKHIEDTLDLTRQYNNLLQRREDGTSASFIWDSALLASSNNGDVNTYLLDYLGSPLRAGSEAFAFDEFGQTLAGNFDTQPFGYTGYQQDSIANTWYAQARQYDSATGRFGAEDVVKGSVLAPQTQNPYTYCWNAPLAFVDLDGRVPISASFGIQGMLQRDFGSIANTASSAASSVGSWVASNTAKEVGVERPSGIANTVEQETGYIGHNYSVASIIRNEGTGDVTGSLQLNTPTIPLPRNTQISFFSNASSDNKVSFGYTFSNTPAGAVSSGSIFASQTGIGVTSSYGAVLYNLKTIDKWTSEELRYTDILRAFEAVFAYIVTAELAIRLSISDFTNHVWDSFLDLLRGIDTNPNAPVPGMIPLYWLKYVMNNLPGSLVRTVC